MRGRLRCGGWVGGEEAVAGGGTSSLDFSQGLVDAVQAYLYNLRDFASKGIGPCQRPFHPMVVVVVGE